MDPSKDWEYYVRTAVIFGVGVLTGAILHKLLIRPPVAGVGKGHVIIDTFSRAARLTAIRAKGLGRNHKMVFVVRNDLGMGKGKIAAQCSHAAVMCYQRAQSQDPENLDIWEATGQTKICVKCDGGEAELKRLEKIAKEVGIVSALVRDGGYTQVSSLSSAVTETHCCLPQSQYL
jgi:PTH2 family peptidyl-tRNA hydrolase